MTKELAELIAYIMITVMVFLIFVPFISSWSKVRKIVGDHIELIDWVQKEYGRESDEVNVVCTFISAPSFVCDWHIEQLQMMAKIAPRRVAEDIRQMLRERENGAQE